MGKMDTHTGMLMFLKSSMHLFSMLALTQNLCSHNGWSLYWCSGLDVIQVSQVVGKLNNSIVLGVSVLGLLHLGSLMRIIRAVHLIPAFAHLKTADLLGQ